MDENNEVLKDGVQEESAPTEEGVPAEPIESPSEESSSGESNDGVPEEDTDEVQE
jgi:hypothetical protein